MQLEQLISAAISAERLSPEPGMKPKFPWRFALGDFVYIHGRRSSAEIVGGELHGSFPHLYLRDPAGDIWRIPQLHCSSTPITFRKG